MKKLGGSPRHGTCWLLFAVLTFASYGAQLSAQTYINEIYFDPPGSSGDKVFEYIELRGSNSASLAGQYLIFLENESSATSNAGVIENIFDLTTQSLGSNGFLVLRQAASDMFYDPEPAGTNVLVNTGTALNFGSGPTSTIGHSDLGGEGEIENSGFTAMLIDIGTGAAPVLDQDLDNGDDGMSDDTFPTGWTVLDSIGVNSEASESDGRLYAPINFSNGLPGNGGNGEPGAVFVDTGFEIEYVGRWGDSTGSGVRDWHASNLTADGQTGSTGSGDYRQAGTFHDPPIGTDNFVETTQGAPYGIPMVNTRGASNLFVLDGDFEYDESTNSFDNDVDGGDFLMWQQNFGFEQIERDGVANDATRRHGDTPDEDGLFDRIVDRQDLEGWAATYGDTCSPAGTASLNAVPEPTACLLGLLCSISLSLSRPKRSAL
ncbi:MAG: hypothetical protein RID07_13570 [Lacipirellulaceae bacterium]